MFFTHFGSNKVNSSPKHLKKWIFSNKELQGSASFYNYRTLAFKAEGQDILHFIRLELIINSKGSKMQGLSLLYHLCSRDYNPEDLSWNSEICLIYNWAMDWLPLGLEIGVRMEKAVHKLLQTQMDMWELMLLESCLRREL